MNREGFLIKAFVPIAASVLILTSCDKQREILEDPNSLLINNEVIKEPNFGINVEISGEQVLFDELGAIKLSVVDSLLLIRQIKGDQPFHIYQLKDMSFIGKLGYKGDGPDDWLAPRSLNQFSVVNGQILTWIHEARRSELRHINLSRSLTESTMVIDRRVKMHPRLGFTHHAVYINDSKEFVIGNLGFESYDKDRLRKYDIETGKVVKAGFISRCQGLQSLSASQKYQLYFDYIGVRPDHKG